MINDSKKKPKRKCRSMTCRRLLAVDIRATIAMIYWTPVHRAPIGPPQTRHGYFVDRSRGIRNLFMGHRTTAHTNQHQSAFLATPEQGGVVNLVRRPADDWSQKTFGGAGGMRSLRAKRKIVNNQ